MRRLGDDERGRRERLLREMYPTMSTSEISDRTGIHKSWLIANARRLGLTHTPETAERLRTKRGEWHIDSSKLSRRRKAIYKMERLRLMSGMPQETNLTVYLVPTRVRDAMRKLAREKGYWYDDLESRTLYYDGNTARTRFERHHERANRISFVEGVREQTKSTTMKIRKIKQLNDGRQERPHGDYVYEWAFEADADTEEDEALDYCRKNLRDAGLPEGEYFERLRSCLSHADEAHLRANGYYRLERNGVGSWEYTVVEPCMD